jgi:hypothetical protein
MPTVKNTHRLRGQAQTPFGVITFDADHSAEVTDEQAAYLGTVPGMVIADPAPAPDAMAQVVAAAAAMKADDVIRDISTLEDTAALTAIAEGEKRPTVRKAASDRLAALAAVV